MFLLASNYNQIQIPSEEIISYLTLAFTISNIYTTLYLLRLIIF